MGSRVRIGMMGDFLDRCGLIVDRCLINDWPMIFLMPVSAKVFVNFLLG